MPFSSKYVTVAPNLRAPSVTPLFDYSDGDAEEYIAAVIEMLAKQRNADHALLRRLPDRTG